MPTPDDLRSDAAANTADGISSASVDGRTSQAISPLTQLDVADRLDARAMIDAAKTDGNFLGRLLGRRAQARFRGPGQ